MPRSTRTGKAPNTSLMNRSGMPPDSIARWRRNRENHSRRRFSSWMSNHGHISARCSRSLPWSANGITASGILWLPPREPARPSLPRWITNACAISSAIYACCLSHIDKKSSNRASARSARFCGRGISVNSTSTATGPTSGTTCSRPFSRSLRST